jgi:hypothetical protein
MKESKKRYFGRFQIFLLCVLVGVALLPVGSLAQNGNYSIFNDAYSPVALDSVLE